MFSISKMSEIAPMGGGGLLFSKMSEIKKESEISDGGGGQANLIIF